jgi:tetratricopeptide (TPR) repeat protein
MGYFISAMKPVHSPKAPAPSLAAAPAPAGNRWILGPKRDLALFILTPLLIIPAWLAAKGSVSLDVLAIYVLGLGGFGHHLPGFVRAYSDPELFRRYKLRFTIVPALLVGGCALFSFLDLNAMVCAAVLWGAWHGAMQINGFMRIYDAKAKSFAPATARLDALMCIAWFGSAILHSPAKQFSLVSQFYASGGFLIPPGAFAALRWAWDAGTLAVTLLFLANALRRRKAGNPPSPIKLAVMASSLAFWWYCTAGLGNLVLGIVLWEVFHDVQYNALVWVFQRQRVDRNLDTGAAERLLFGRGPARFALYALLILAYGSIGVISSFGDINMPEKAFLGSAASQWLLRITIASALLHFYFDGFIWKVRERNIREGLGMREAGKPEAAAPKPTGFPRHGLRWAYFAVPVACLGFSQLAGKTADFQSQVINLADAIPGSWMAEFLSGTWYKGQGRFDRAEEYYRRAVASNPDFAMGQMFLADILYKRQDLSGALEHYRLSVAADPDNPEARMNLGFLYLRSGQPAPAATELRLALERIPDNAELAFGLAEALMQQHQLPEAGTWLDRTLSLSPHHSGALNYSGVIHEFNGDARGAIDLYRRALEADSSNVSARANLAAALSKPGAIPVQAPAPR